MKNKYKLNLEKTFHSEYHVLMGKTMIKSMPYYLLSGAVFLFLSILLYYVANDWLRVLFVVILLLGFFGSLFLITSKIFDRVSDRYFKEWENTDLK